MAHIALETMIAAPIRAVFEVLRTPARRPEWMTNLHEIRNVTGQGLDDSWEDTAGELSRTGWHRTRMVFCSAPSLCGMCSMRSVV
jgi:uncharacterized protein YndB with AHSA1/START domain